VLYAIVRDHLEAFLKEARGRDGDGYHLFIERELRRYLASGLLTRGFARVRCPAPYANLVRYHGVFAGRSRSLGLDRRLRCRVRGAPLRWSCSRSFPSRW
jgi:hypothetical protein